MIYPTILCNAIKGLYNALMKYCGNLTLTPFTYQRLRLFLTIRALYRSYVSLNTKVKYLQQKLFFLCFDKTYSISYFCFMTVFLHEGVTF